MSVSVLRSPAPAASRGGPNAREQIGISPKNKFLLSTRLAKKRAFKSIFSIADAVVFDDAFFGTALFFLPPRGFATLLPPLAGGKYYHHSSQPEVGGWGEGCEDRSIIAGHYGLLQKNNIGD